MLPKAIWLDPRREAEQPIADSVIIPIDQLSDRVYELPKRSEIIRIADVGEEARQALDILVPLGFQAELGQNFQFGMTKASRLWSPTHFLESIVDQLPVGQALDLACGSGRDSVFLASIGFRTMGWDHLPDAIEMAGGLAGRYLEDPSMCQWKVCDLEQPLLLGEYDLVTCFLFLNRDVIRQVPNLVKQGGSFVMETFTTVHRDATGKPRREHFALRPGELPSLLPEFEIQLYVEDWHEGRHTARYWGVRN
jgi:SAM-dependent methyltransferase